MRYFSSFTILAIALLLNLAGTAFAAPAIYQIDLRFLIDGSSIQSGTQEEIDRYNSDSGNAPAHPVFSEEAVLDFGSRKVRVFLIASHHDGAADVDFVEKTLASFSASPKSAALFVEQSDAYNSDGAVTVLHHLIQSRAPDLMPAMNSAQRNPNSFLDPDFYEKLTFAKVARHWQSAGGNALNMDLSSNFSDSAIGFLTSQTDMTTAAHFLRIQLDTESFSFPDFQKMLLSVYGKSFNPAIVNPMEDCCGTSRNWIRTFLAENQTRDLIRERYMRRVLLENLKDGDVIITHPVHMRHLLNPERRPLAN